MTEQWRYQEAEEWKYQQSEEMVELPGSDVEVDHPFIGWVDLNIPSELQCVRKFVMLVEMEVELSLKLFPEVGRESAAICTVTQLPLPCFVGSLGSERSEIANKFNQQ